MKTFSSEKSIFWNDSQLLTIDEIGGVYSQCLLLPAFQRLIDKTINFQLSDNCRHNGLSFSQYDQYF